MTLNLSDKYYLTALDWYPGNLEDCTDALNYALSYDPEHAPSHCMIGSICGYHLKDTYRAFHHFELSILYDPHYLDAYYHYLNVLIINDYFQKADVLLRKSMNVHGIDQAQLLMYSAKSHEQKGNYTIARISVKRARQLSVCDNQLEYIERLEKRIKSKTKMEKERG